MVGLGLWSVGKGCGLDSFCAFMYVQMFGMMILRYVRMMKLRAFISPINGSTGTAYWECQAQVNGMMDVI